MAKINLWIGLTNGRKSARLPLVHAISTLGISFRFRSVDRSKNATGNDIALNFGEPKLDLISQEE
jgi:hypothetical protein